MTSHSIPCYLPSLIYFHHRTCHQLPHDASAYLSSVFSHHLEINFTGGGICVPRASYEASGKERIPFLSALPGQVIISPTWTVLNPSSPSNLQTSSCPQQEFSTLKLECNWFCYNRSWAPLLPNPTLPYCLQWTCTLSRRWLPLFPQSKDPCSPSSGPATPRHFSGLMSSPVWLGRGSSWALPQHPYWIQTLILMVCLLTCCISHYIRKIQFGLPTPIFPVSFTAHTEYFTLTLLPPNGRGFFSTARNSLWNQLEVLQFNSTLTVYLESVKGSVPHDCSPCYFWRQSQVVIQAFPTTFAQFIYKMEVPTTPSSGLINLLEVTELRETLCLPVY